MGNNKKSGKKRVKKEIVYRTKKERQEQVKTILKQLSELELTIAYEPIKLLYAIFKEYIEEGTRLKINIPFPAINRRIKGLLAISTNEEVWVKLENEKF